MDQEEIEKKNLADFKTADGKHFTGLIDNPDLEIIENFNYESIENYPSRNLKFMKARGQSSGLLGQSIDDVILPNTLSYVSSCGTATNQGIGSCYMHAIVNQARWLVWMHTGKLYSPSNHTIDYVYAQGVSGGLYNDIARFWNAPDDDFTRAFKSVASKCGITKSNSSSGSAYSGVGASGKKNAIKMLNAYGPLWFAHDCGLYTFSGYHAIIFVGYDEEYAYFQNSWGADAGTPKVTWSRFTSYSHSYNTYFQTYGNVSGVNIWKGL